MRLHDGSILQPQMSWLPFEIALAYLLDLYTQPIQEEEKLGDRHWLSAGDVQPSASGPQRSLSAPEG